VSDSCEEDKEEDEDLIEADETKGNWGRGGAQWSVFPKFAQK